MSGGVLRDDCGSSPHDVKALRESLQEISELAEEHDFARISEQAGTSSEALDGLGDNLLALDKYLAGDIGEQTARERHRSLLSKLPEYNISGDPVAVLQGWDTDDYLRCVDRYRDRGLLTDYVGVGSVCRRHAQAEIRDVLSAVRDALPPRCRLHAFGVKTSVLQYAEVRDLLTSADSLAYDYAAQSRVASQLDGRSMQWRDVAREALKMRFRIEQLFDDTETDGSQTTLSEL